MTIRCGLCRIGADLVPLSLVVSVARKQRAFSRDRSNVPICLHVSVPRKHKEAKELEVVCLNMISNRLQCKKCHGFHCLLRQMLIQHLPLALYRPEDGDSSRQLLYDTRVALLGDRSYLH
jgi:hypothetical protein